MNSTLGLEESPTQSQFVWSAGEIVRFVTLIAGGIIIVVFNILILVVVAKYRKLRTWTNCLLLSMAVADLMLGAVSIPTHLVADVNVFGQNEMWCVVLNIPTVIVSVASVLSLIAASIERILAIMFPLRYPDWVSGKRILASIVFIWLYSLTLGFLPILGWNNIDDRKKANATLTDCNFAAVMSGGYTGLFVAGNIFPGTVFLLCLNAKLFCIVKSQRKRCTSVKSQPSGSTLTLSESQNSSCEQRTSHHIQKSRRVIFILLVICHVNILSYIPVCVAFIMDYQWFTVTLITEWKAPYILYAIGAFLAAMNSISNPIILGFANRDIRRHIKLLCGSHETKNENSLSLVSNNVIP